MIAGEIAGHALDDEILDGGGPSSGVDAAAAEPRGGGERLVGDVVVVPAVTFLLPRRGSNPRPRRG